MLVLNNLITPHLGKEIIYTGTTAEDAKRAMILLHGRGAPAASMYALLESLTTEKMLYIIPQAADYIWYPYRFIEKRSKNEPGITSGLTLVHSIVEALVREGIGTHKIYLLGFSQGACLALDYAAHNPARYGGVFALSGGLIGEELNGDDYQGDLQQTPVFLGCSNVDFHIPVERVHESSGIFEHLNAVVTEKIYPDMGHTINMDEMDFINRILSEKSDIKVTAAES